MAKLKFDSRLGRTPLHQLITKRMVIIQKFVLAKRCEGPNEKNDKKQEKNQTVFATAYRKK